MAVQKWDTPESAFIILNTASDFHSLANGSRVLTSAGSSPMASGVVPNLTDGYTHADISASFAHTSSIFASTPLAGAFLGVYAIPDIDGSYVDGSGSVAPPPNCLIGRIPIAATANQTAFRRPDWNMEIPNKNFKIIIQNNTGVAFASSGLTVAISFRRHNLKNV